MNDSTIIDLEDLEDRLSTPTPGVLDVLSRLEGDILVLGVAGKMGPTLARMARRTSDELGMRRRVIGVARFTNPALETRLRSQGVETIAVDLLGEHSLDGLPEAPNIVYMAGRKFGTSGQEAMTWAMNAFLPSQVARRFRQSRIVAFSTGNVYGSTRIHAPSRERDPLAPEGEYAMSCLARERIFEHFSRTYATPMAIIRLNYAAEMRYGVLVDLAERVRDGRPIDLTVGSFNVVWQRDANAMALRSFDHVATPPRILNVAGPEILSVRQVAETLGRLMSRSVQFTGSESGSAVLNDASEAFRLFGMPTVSAETLISWVADWIGRGGPTLGAPTHFEVSDGRF